MESTHRLHGLLENGFNFRIGHYFTKGFELYRQNLPLFLGFGFVYMIIMMGSSSIPLIGLLGFLILYGPFAIGGFYGAHVIARKETLTFNDFFKGFNDFGKLLLQVILACLMWLLLSIPFLIYFGMEMFKLIQELQNSTTDPGMDSFMDAVWGMNWVGLIALILVPYILMLTYRWASAFTFFYNSSSWEGLEWSRKFIMKRFFPFVGMSLILGIMVYGFSAITTYFYLNMFFDTFSFEMIAEDPEGFTESIQNIARNNWWIYLGNIPYIFIIPFACCVHYVAFAEITELHRDFDSTVEQDLYDHLVE